MFVLIFGGGAARRLGSHDCVPRAARPLALWPQTGPHGPAPPASSHFRSGFVTMTRGRSRPWVPFASWAGLPVWDTAAPADGRRLAFYPDRLRDDDERRGFWDRPDRGAVDAGWLRFSRRGSGPVLSPMSPVCTGCPQLWSQA